MKQKTQNKIESQAINTGLFEEDINVYHSRNAIGSTHLRTFMNSKMMFANLFFNNFEVKTDALVVGSALHCYILEPKLFSNRFAVYPSNIDRRTKAGKEEWQNFNAENADKDLLSADQLLQVYKMAGNIKNHNLASQLLKEIEVEKSARVELSNGLLVQCRPDAIKDNCIIDIKTCQDINKFKWDIKSHRYDIQASFYYFILSSIYPERFKESDFYFIAVDKTQVNDVKVFGVDNVTLNNILEKEVKPAIKDLGNFLQSVEDLSKYKPFQEEIDWLNL